MKSINTLAKLSLLFIFLVILAGSVVRMTGSGMGCPDWPKCFGYLVPPTNDAILQWESGREFKKGQMIIVQETLLVAQQDFKSDVVFNASHWLKYTKHDYATFNATHTWIEYINRLCGALSGIPVLLLVFMSFKNRQKASWLFTLSLLTLFMLGFEAWLGKTVVDGNLIPGQITIHMVGAVAIVVLLLAILTKTEKKITWFPKNLQGLLFAAIMLSILQIIMGSQVREEVDSLLASSVSRNDIISTISGVFEWHRTLAILVIACNGFLFWKTKRFIQTKHMSWIAGIIGLEVLAGIGLSYFGLTPWLQPTHLMLAIILLSVQVHLAFSMKLGYSKSIS